MKTYNISSGKINSEIILPRSKSCANRLLILAAMAEKETIIEHLPEVDDVRLLLEALKKIGILHRTQGHTHYLFGSFPTCVSVSSPITLDVGEGGTTARFLAAMLTLDHRVYQLQLSGKLAQRPWNELLEALTSLGVKTNLSDHLLTIQGPVQFKEKILSISAKRSTQFASALKLAFSNYINIVPENLSASMSYWKLTEDLVEKFKTVNHFVIPIDWSGASYPLCFAALTSETYFPGLHYDTHQADSKLFDILNQLGAIKKMNEDGLTVTPIKNRSRSLKLNVEDCLDLVPALCFLLSHLEGTHELSGVSNLVHKESDRLSEVMKLMNLFERVSRYDSSTDTLIINGHLAKISSLRDIQTASDHRMIMTASLFLKFHSGGSIAHPEAVEKSFHSFFEVCGI